MLSAFLGKNPQKWEQNRNTGDNFIYECESVTGALNLATM